MIRLREVDLPAGAARWLDTWQSDINSVSTQYAVRVARAKLLWGRKPHQDVRERGSLPHIHVLWRQAVLLL